MKQFALAFFLAFVLAGAVAAEPPSADDASRAKAVLLAYKDAIENLDGAAATALFTQEAQIFEQGGLEGTWAQYLERHLGPEFDEIVSFEFSNYQAGVEVTGDLAVAWETYSYTIVLKDEAEPIVRLGAATSILRRAGDSWLISLYHSSSRKPPA